MKLIKVEKIIIFINNYYPRDYPVNLTTLCASPPDFPGKKQAQAMPAELASSNPISQESRLWRICPEAEHVLFMR
jgi:hypothetical protein